jgi:hypothetical protein
MIAVAGQRLWEGYGRRRTEDDREERRWGERDWNS